MSGPTPFDTAQRLHDFALNATAMNDASFERFVRHSTLRLLRMLFYQISFGNTNLDKVYRVALFEPNENNELVVTHYYNSERRRPRLYSLDRKFIMQEGVAGWAWYFKQPFCIPNVPEYLITRDVDAPVYFKENFEDELMTPDDSSLLAIKSIICYPIVIMSKGEEIVKAVISVDCDKEGELDHRTAQKAKQLRINLYPFIRLFELLYATGDIVRAKYGSSDIDHHALHLSP